LSAVAGGGRREEGGGRREEGGGRREEGVERREGVPAQQSIERRDHSSAS